ncbi:hypothetical protein TSUD_402220 [Trifolium subterraneum]|uniref:Reverse transcriptase domain-containing protein n=1 Tax=Trifolium subterraneum TaxID=3900 RepID=A0A2Z6PC42_TRISU|nr:hypothetical protein TSUD_402220 [Trifolium subterraneum]
MKIFSYNIRGLGAGEKRREVRRLIMEKRPDVFCLQETKLEVVDDALCRSLWGSETVQYSYKPAVGASRGIITMWDASTVNVWMSVTMSHCLLVKGKFIKNNVDFVLTNVYAPCDNRGRLFLWNELSGMIQRFSSVVWCVLGDFNVVRSSEERKSRSVNGNNDDFASFNHFIDGNFPLRGRKFTWYCGDGLSMSRLDLFLLSDAWITSYPNCVQVALARGLSDHCPIMLSIEEQNWGPKPLRMLKCWADIPGYGDFVKENWQFFSKIQVAKNRLATLDVVGESRSLVAEEETEMHLLTADILGYSKLKASMQWQKSRVDWLKEDGVSVEGVAEVRQTVYQNFRNHFQKKLHNRPDIDGLVFKLISSSDGADLIKPFFMEEIKAAIWDCDSYKCPGPDRINWVFFKDFWEVLKIDLLNFFAEFHHNGKLTKGLNSTFIALIPKVESPQCVADFRPIALVSSVYKILSKVLANRLRNIVGTVVSTNQSTFIKDRQILDGILIANEIVDEAKKEKKDLLLFKVDFEKAYDSVDWGYLEAVMLKMNFPGVWRNWIMECVSTATASVLVNGSPTDEFGFERGFRQGDPLSPFLFLLAAEGLHVMMSALVSNRLFTPFGIRSQNTVYVRALKAVLILFQSISGLKVNFNKSMLFGVNVNDSWLHEAASVMNCKHGRLPFLYLGLPIGGDPRKLQFWYPLVDRICNRLSGWKCKNLSVGGRLIMLKSVLSSIPVYFLSFFKSPSGKWVWRCMEERESLWNVVLCAKYGQTGGRVKFEEGTGSIWWRTLNEIRAGVGMADPGWMVDNIIREVGDGHSTLFWTDPWLEERPLARIAFTIIWISVLYIIWKDRNKRIFTSGADTLETMA